MMERCQCGGETFKLDFEKSRLANMEPINTLEIECSKCGSSHGKFEVTELVRGS